jgi:putative secretion ATPase (PEP-CTERM system associated)
MYEQFFNLDQKPFELLPNPGFLYLSRSHKKALSYLEYGIREGAGFILLTGEVGSGKTTLIRNIVKKLDARTALSMVFNTRVTPEQLINLINDDFGLDVTGKDKVALLRDLNSYFLARHSENIRPIIIIDEAQNLSSDALEEIRLLSNLERETCKLVQIILVGQPELKTLIAQPQLRQLRQRIGISCHLEPLRPEETEEYIYHRLEKAGNREAVRFHDGTFEVIYRYSLGIPRLINVFCDFLMLAAFVDETRELTLELVEEVVGDVAGETPEVWREEGGADSEEDFNAVWSAAAVKRSTGAPLAQVGMASDPLIRRLSLHEDALKTIMENQQEGNHRFEGFLETIARSLDELRSFVLHKKDQGKEGEIELKVPLKNDTRRPSPHEGR